MHAARAHERELKLLGLAVRWACVLRRKALSVSYSSPPPREGISIFLAELRSAKKTNCFSSLSAFFFVLLGFNRKNRGLLRKAPVFAQSARRLSAI